MKKREIKWRDGLLKDKLQDDKVQTRIEKYPRPGNVEGLRTPRVNPLIWSQILAQVRPNDSKSQKSQNALVASSVAMIKATNLVLEQEDDDAKATDKAVVSTVTDVITLAKALLSRYEFVEAPGDEERPTSRLLGPLYFYYSPSYLRVLVWRSIQTNKGYF